MQITDQKVTLQYILRAVAAVFFTWIIHEFAHWITYRFYGFEALMSLNKVNALDNEAPTDVQNMIISAAGPIMTILQAVTIYLFLAIKKWDKYLYPLLFTAFYMRFLAGLMNFISLNDEGRISSELGIGTFTISIIISGFLFFLVYRISRKYALNWKFQLLTIIIVMVTSSLIILGDQFYDIRLL